jgi:hypothetical protein
MRSFLSGLVAWLRQPTSVAGLATVSGALSGLATGAMPLRVALPVIAGGVVAVFVPDNTTAVKDVQQVVSDTETIAAVAATIAPRA